MKSGYVVCRGFREFRVPDVGWCGGWSGGDGLLSESVEALVGWWVLRFWRTFVTSWSAARLGRLVGRRAAVSAGFEGWLRGWVRVPRPSGDEPGGLLLLHTATGVLSSPGARVSLLPALAGPGPSPAFLRARLLVRRSRRRACGRCRRVCRRALVTSGAWASADRGIQVRRSRFLGGDGAGGPG